MFGFKIILLLIIFCYNILSKSTYQEWFS